METCACCIKQIKTAKTEITRHRQRTINVFDIFYIGENTKLKDALPFAKQVESYDEIMSRTKMYWVVEPNIEIVDSELFDFRPVEYDQDYEHVWKWSSKNYGGVKLLPKNKSKGTKEINRVVCRKSFDTLNTSTPEVYFDHHPYATHVWCVDKEYKLTNEINWAPDNFEPTFIHSFHLRGQLEHKYPEKEGGIKLYPREWKTAQIKYHSFLDAGIDYPVLYIDDVDDYAQRDKFNDEYVWLIDQEHCIDTSTLDWVPNPFEQDYIHCFRMPYQLTEKYPQSMGGIRLVPRNWKSAELKIHPACPVADEEYDVFYTNKPFNADTFDFYAKRSETDWFWVIDRDYDFNGKLLYVPASHEREYIHVFKWGLEYRYPPEVTELWDNRVAGIYLINKNYDITKQKLHTDTVPVRYDIFFTQDINDYATYARKSRTDAFWLVDDEHTISEVFKWVPDLHDQPYINIFKLPGQLQHKYPISVTNVSDNRCGGIKLVPKTYDETQRKYQGLLTAVEIVEFEKFESESEGRTKTKHDWFWVVDPNVTVIENFDFDFIPDTWDEGKTHVWQKLNPITGRQYDYAGVMLCPKVSQAKGRPKYVREAACTQKQFPIFNLDPQLDIIEQLTHTDSTVENSMYWVVDPFTRVNPDFKFDYYPTQWDQQNVHVFADEDGAYRNIRLYPKGTFATTTLTSKDVANNSFEKLKQINTIGSLRPQWPVLHLQDVTKTELVTALQEFANQEVPFLWTVDPDVSVEQGMLDAGYLPDLLSINKIHVWQRQNPHTRKVHSYGGLRLWPTQKDYSQLTTDSIRLNKLKDIQYVKELGSTYEPYDIVFLSYKEEGATSAYKRLTARFPATWVKDVAGIFEAHKAAAQSGNSKMFWVVDADADILDTFEFGYIPDVYDQEVVHVWASKNPITGMEYGYGGVKLFNREQVINATSWGLDFTTGLSTRFKAMPEVSCVTRFNTDAYSTWRSAFRECVKLALKDDAESIERLDGWLHPVPDAFFRHDAKRGAEEGRAYALANRNDIEALARINDYEWLRNRYNQQ